MRVNINGGLIPVIGEQEFQEMQESFARHIDEYRRKHWFKEFIYQFTGGEDLVDMNRIKATLWFWKLRITLKALRFSFRLSPPSEAQAEELVEVLERLRDKLEYEDYD